MATGGPTTTWLLVVLEFEEPIDILQFMHPTTYYHFIFSDNSSGHSNKDRMDCAAFLKKGYIGKAPLMRDAFIIESISYLWPSGYILEMWKIQSLFFPTITDPSGCHHLREGKAAAIFCYFLLGLCRRPKPPEIDMNWIMT